MTDADGRGSPMPLDTPAGTTAGAMLRAAREAQGLHIAALAAAIKVTPKKVEALEGDRLGELPDATFARALAQTICRHLKIDPKPVLARLPASGAIPLEPASRIQGTPYRERSGRADQQPSVRSLGPLLWGAAILIVAAAVVQLVPSTWWNLSGTAGPKAAPAASKTIVPTPSPAPAPSAAATTAPTGEAPAAPPAVAAPAASAAPFMAPAMLLSSGTQEAAKDRPSSAETVFSAPPQSAGAAPSVGGALVITTTDASWVEVRDAKGRTLLGEIVQPGRTVGVDGPLPLKLLVGNAAATQLLFMGKPVDVIARSRENVARFELQ